MARKGPNIGTYDMYLNRIWWLEFVVENCNENFFENIHVINEL